jgi:ribosomal protein S6
MDTKIVNDIRYSNLDVGDYFTFNKSNMCGKCHAVRRIIKNSSGYYMAVNVKTGEVAVKEMSLKDLLRQYSDIAKVKIVGYDKDTDTLLFEVVGGVN